MSHSHERQDKTCLNCGSQVTGRYCQDCGQENVEPKESAWHLIVHFFNDVTHFDGKFFKSMKYLLFKPGFLTDEYVKGRRASYVNPIRMYLFISAAFFLIMMSFVVGKSSDTVHIEDDKKPTPKKTRGLHIDLAKTARNAATKLDTLVYEGDSDAVVLKNGDRVMRKHLDTFMAKTVDAYDSLQQLLPKEEQDGTFGRYMSRKLVKATTAMQGDKKTIGRQVLTSFWHSMPYMLFVSLPFMALLLKLIYIRRKQYYYVSHAIFVVHLFCFIFITFLAIEAVEDIKYAGEYLVWGVRILSYIYLYKAMLYFYKQGWFKTLIKFLLFYVLGVSFIILIFTTFLVNSFLNLG